MPLYKKLLYIENSQPIFTVNQLTGSNSVGPLVELIIAQTTVHMQNTKYKIQFSQSIVSFLFTLLKK